jgi:hypothetical protein
MLSIRAAQLQQMASASPGTSVIAPCVTTWIEIRLVDQDNVPIPGQKYRVTLPDATIVRGVLDTNGRAYFGSIVPGPCQVCFPDIDAREWKPA